MYGRAELMGQNIRSTVPANTSTSAGAEPLYGTCVSWVEVSDWKISADMCCGLPAPAEAYVSLDGSALAIATSSSIEFALNFSGTTNAIGTVAIRPTPAKSFCTSKGSFGYSAGFTATVWLGAMPSV